MLNYLFDKECIREKVIIAGNAGKRLSKKSMNARQVDIKEH